MKLSTGVKVPQPKWRRLDVPPPGLTRTEANNYWQQLAARSRAKS